MNFWNRLKTVGNCFTLLLVSFGVLLFTVLVHIVKSLGNQKIVPSN